MSCNCRSTCSNKSRTDSLKTWFRYRLFFVTQKSTLDPNQKKTNNHQIISLSQKKEQKKNAQANFLSKDKGFFLTLFHFPISSNSGSHTWNLGQNFLTKHLIIYTWLCFTVKTVCSWAVNISTLSKRMPKELQQIPWKNGPPLLDKQTGKICLQRITTKRSEKFKATHTLWQNTHSFIFTKSTLSNLVKNCPVA